LSFELEVSPYGNDVKPIIYDQSRDIHLGVGDNDGLWDDFYCSEE